MTQKKLLWRLLALLLAFSLVAAACGDDDDDDTSTGGDDGTEQPSDDGTADDEAADDSAADDSAADDEAADDSAADDSAADDEAADDSMDDGTGDEGADDEAMDDPFAGCGDQAETDPTDFSLGRAVARCDSGYPMPIPLEERQTIRLSSSFRLEFIAPILLAEYFGEFEKENLDFEFISLPYAEALPQLGTGDIDLSVGGIEGSWFNQVDNGFDIRMVSGNFWPPNAGDLSIPQDGLWARADVFSDPSNPDLAEMAGTTIASSVGLTSVVALPISKAFSEAGITYGEDVEVIRIPSPDMEQALRNDTIQAAWMISPLYVPLVDDPEFVQIVGQTPGVPLGGLWAGPGCHTEKRDACVAFHRAIIRTINTYLSGDYHDDDEVVQAISETTDVPVDTIKGAAEVNFHWEIPEGPITEIQELFISFNDILDEEVVTMEEPFPEDQLVDRSIYLEAVGRG